MPNGVKRPIGSPADVFRVFLKLGLTSFGGPIAHIGYFRNEFVVRRQWLSEAQYGELVALCQFLPGPASSQVGFSLGILRGGGILGGLAAWTAFTMPSALILLGFAVWASAFSGPVATGCLHGLKLVAVAVVAQAVWGMTRTLIPDKIRAGIALAAIFCVVGFGGSAGQVIAIALGALAGLVFCQADLPAAAELQFPISRRAAVTALVAFAVLFAATVLKGSAPHWLALFDSFYRSGALVFGGGHVVLPLLQDAVVKPGWVSDSTFIAGYGVTQAVPGPLFAFAAYLGAVMQPSPSGIAGAAISLVAIFLPGLLLVYGTLPFWSSLRARHEAQAAMRGANAAVVGILAAAFYDPVWTSAVTSAADFALGAAGFLLLVVWKWPSWGVVVLLAAIGGLQIA